MLCQVKSQLLLEASCCPVADRQYHMILRDMQLGDMYCYNNQHIILKLIKV